MGCMRVVRDMSDAFRCAFVQDRENKIVGCQGGACLTVERYFFFFLHISCCPRPQSR